jgi:hypothetical protein
LVEGKDSISMKTNKQYRPLPPIEQSFAIIVASIVLFSVLISCCPVCHAAYGSRKVHSVSLQLPAVPSVDVSGADKLLNDLKLSPYWNVEKNRNGQYEAHARCILPDSPFDETGRQFLFDLFSEPQVTLPKDWRIRNYYMEGYSFGEQRSTFTTLAATIVFKKPTDSAVSIPAKDGKVTLTVNDYFEDKIGLNSYSLLAVPLSTTNDIYLVVREQGNDVNRTATLKMLPSLMKEVATVAKLPAKYRVAVQYKRFLETFFHFPLKEVEVKRRPGLQDRDTFYGCLKAKPEISYEGINIRISHPVYCSGECTRDSERLRKAEYLGKPYYDDDPLFFLIEDNAVYLVSGEYNKRFGTFSGKESFEGTLEILNGEGKTLHESKEKFKGWER